MQCQTHSDIPATRLMLIFGMAGPPAGFIAAVAGVTAFFETPEGINALIYALHPLGLALIYAGGLAPALATAGALALIQDRGTRPTLPYAGVVGFLITACYGLVATSTAVIPNASMISLALAGIGAISAVICLMITRAVPKILADPTEAR